MIKNKKGELIVKRVRITLQDLLEKVNYKLAYGPYTNSELLGISE